MGGSRRIGRSYGADVETDHVRGPDNGLYVIRFTCNGTEPHCAKIKLIVHSDRFFAYKISLISKVIQIEKVIRLMKHNMVEIRLGVERRLFGIRLIKVKARINDGYFYLLFQLFIAEVLCVGDVLSPTDDNGHDIGLNQFSHHRFYGHVSIPYRCAGPDVAQVSQTELIIPLKEAVQLPA